MQSSLESLTVEALVAYRSKEFAKANPEYQRGVVWNPDQQKKLIDSVLRGYQLPVIYLHYKERTEFGLKQQSYDIIDGQQRMESLYRFHEGAFPLLAPSEPSARFPRFIADQPCSWAGKRFPDLSEDLKEQFLSTELPVAIIESNDDNEIRDLFVRLQAGSSLNSQERRDAYPGAFTDFVLTLGGKPDIARYPGHDFFQRVLRMKPARDRGRTRQLAAQIAMLYMRRQEKGEDFFTDTSSGALDDYYYENLDFDSASSESKRLIEILDKLDVLLGDGKRPNPRGHGAMHLALFLDSIWDSYTRSWESRLADAHDEFTSRVAEATKKQKEGVPDEYWNFYGVWTRSNSDRGENIQRRHTFYSQRMREFMGNDLKPKDPKRSFGPLERELIYFRDSKRCAVCSGEVIWKSAEIHHVLEHQAGGQTTLDNGVLVHGECHPKGQAAKDFALELQSQQASID